MSGKFPGEPSAFGHHIGMRLVDWQPGAARVELALSEVHGNRQGLPHGGIHASLLDSAMGYTGCHPDEGGRNALTLSLNVQYLSRPEGRRLIATGRRTGGGKSTFFAEAEVTDETGAVIAKGTGVFRYRDPS